MSPAVILDTICKSYSSQRVLSDVSFSIERGETVSLIGENGAGKSTVAKIIAGIVQPDTGSMSVFGVSGPFSHPSQAAAAGVGIVHQEISLLDNLSVAENICLGREPRRYGLLDRGAMRTTAGAALARLSLTIDPGRRVGTLSLAQKQRVEIARALAYEARLIIFDEPTSSLSEHDADALLSAIESLKAIGVSTLYVSHRLSEVMRISDRVIALRDGVLSGELRAPFASREQLIESMIGRQMKDMFGYSPRSIGEPVLELTRFQASPCHEPLTASVRAGEILGIAGLVGSGRTELMEALYGVRPSCTGRIVVRGRAVAIRSPLDAMRAGIVLAPESRKEQGIVGSFSISDSIALSPWGAGIKSPLVRSRSAEASQAEHWIQTLAIKCATREQSVSELSGGNQQKVVLGRCLSSKPAVLLLDEPTRGIDVGARRAIYQQLFSLAAQGLAIIAVSSELEEIFGIADSILVMSEGRVTGKLTRAEFSEHAYMNLAAPPEPSEQAVGNLR